MDLSVKYRLNVYLTSKIKLLRAGLGSFVELFEDFAESGSIDLDELLDVVFV